MVIALDCQKLHTKVVFYLILISVSLLNISGVAQQTVRLTSQNHTVLFT